MSDTAQELGAASVGVGLGREVLKPRASPLGRRAFTPHRGPDQACQLSGAHVWLRVEPVVQENLGVELSAVLLEDKVRHGRVVDEAAKDRGPVEHTVTAGP
ncbi:hypothetical protein [Microtetraspora sp. NBRC 16547]|uniref:hypothetical protein n=1 Tax=Microtetraspora sp. NBRC 16547 TaxID=3030993 RepID=UPI0025543B2D|nr:hypothetical protein [Microtetraspora sp. NBRC 16547]